MTELIPRDTVADIVARRNLALATYDDYWTKLAAAHAAAGEATQVAKGFGEGGAFRYNHKTLADSLITGFTLPDQEKFTKTVRGIVDSDAWAHIITLTGLEQLMDKTAKEELRDQLRTDPPELTEETVIATLLQLGADAETIFRRGIARCFSELDRRFRSHTGWKIGNRIILERCFDEWGYWCYRRDKQATLFDVERTFRTLDGDATPADYRGAVGFIDHARAGGYGARQTEVETEYFTFRIYKNGNLHIWFKRDDLVTKVNKLLAEYYGEVIPKDRDEGDRRQAEQEDMFRQAETQVAKNDGFYPTPPDLAKCIVDDARLHPEGLMVLEPSAGTGNLARLAVGKGATVDCLEINPKLAADLQAEGIYRDVCCANFLQIPPRPIYDRIIMNPPFDRELDVAHVLHALKFLKPDGFLIAIMGAGVEFRETRKSALFRKQMEKLNARFSDLPMGSFSSVGTNVNTVTVRVYADGRQFYW